MKREFLVANIRCEGCANTIKKALFERFGEGVEVDLSVMPRKVTVQMADPGDEEFFISTLRKLGYPLFNDTVSYVEGAVLKGKSFVSCAVGKMNPTKEK